MMKAAKLWWLRHKLKRSNKSYSRYIDNAKDKEERESLISEAIQERSVHREEILNLISILLSDKAESLGLEVPPLSDKQSWEEGWMPGTIRLNLRAQSQLRSAIRNEQREKWGVFVFVLKEIVVPVVGLLGAIMGLLSLISRISFKVVQIRCHKVYRLPSLGGSQHALERYLYDGKRESPR